MAIEITETPDQRQLRQLSELGERLLAERAQQKSAKSHGLRVAEEYVDTELRAKQRAGR